MKIKLTKPVLTSTGRGLWTGEEFNIVPGSVTGPVMNEHPGYCEIVVWGNVERVYYPEFELTEGASEGAEISRDITPFRTQPTEGLARRLALALADEAVHHGDAAMSEGTLELLSEVRTKLCLEKEFDELDRFKKRE